MEDEEYRYMIWNNVHKEYQFPRICETTEKGANTILFQLIGNDARKHRFEIVKVQKDDAKEIVRDLKLKYKTRKVQQLLPKIEFNELYEIVEENERIEKLGE